MAPPQKKNMFLKFEVFLWMPHVPLLVCLEGFCNSGNLGFGCWVDDRTVEPLVSFWHGRLSLSYLLTHLQFHHIEYHLLLYYVNMQDMIYQCHYLKMLNTLMRNCTLWDLGHGLRRLLSTLAAACWWHDDVLCYSLFFFSQVTDWVMFNAAVFQQILYQADEKKGKRRALWILLKPRALPSVRALASLRFGCWCSHPVPGYGVIGRVWKGRLSLRSWWFTNSRMVHFSWFATCILYKIV